MKFIVDANVGKLTKWLRLLGYDAVFFNGKNDGEMVSQALTEDRIILTRDTHILEWGVVRHSLGRHGQKARKTLGKPRTLTVALPAARLVSGTF